MSKILAARDHSQRHHPFLLYCQLTDDVRKEWLVKNLLGVGEASAVYGKPGDGKSVLVEDLALHVSAGRDWLGRPVRQGAVLYVALERRKLVERRAIAFRNKYGLFDLPFAIMGGVHDFRDTRNVHALIETAREVSDQIRADLGLIVIDTLSRALCGGDENSPKDMGAMVNATSILQEGTKAHVLWVHHTPIDGNERLRGHGALLGAMDTTLHVAKSGDFRTATVVKANDSEEGVQVAFTLESVVISTDADGQDTTAPVVVPIDGEAPRPMPTRKLSDRNKLAMEALTECLLEHGRPADSSIQLPAGITVVPLSDWRDEMLRRGILDDSAPNPRTDFKRIREQLQVRRLIGVNGEVAWKA